MTATIIITRNKRNSEQFDVGIYAAHHQLPAEVFAAHRAKKLPDDCPPARLRMLRPYLYGIMLSESVVQEFVAAHTEAN